MKIIQIFLLFGLVNEIYTLKPGSLPSGNKKIFQPNKLERNKDLILVSPANINLLTKHWLNNILACSKEIEPEDKYVIKQIDDINEYIKGNTRKIYNKTNDCNIKNLYIAWCPKGYFKEIIFIVVGDILLEERKYKVKYVLHSPFWDSTQIDSIHLKYALEDLINNIDNFKLDLSYLCKNDERYKLSWINWGSEYNK